MRGAMLPRDLLGYAEANHVIQANYHRWGWKA
jgi:hypothetical protein